MVYWWKTACASMLPASVVLGPSTLVPSRAASARFLSSAANASAQARPSPLLAAQTMAVRLPKREMRHPIPPQRPPGLALRWMNTTTPRRTPRAKSAIHRFEFGVLETSISRLPIIALSTAASTWDNLRCTWRLRFRKRSPISAKLRSPPNPRLSAWNWSVHSSDTITTTISRSPSGVITPPSTTGTPPFIMAYGCRQQSAGLT